MKDNREILNEVFFKKASGIDKFKADLPSYSPIKKTAGAFEVTDTDEVKKRLAGTYGVIFGNNSVKSMASRAIKSFPIVISENVDPETAVMLKRLMEEQYADYINLLVSNQVVDLADYHSSEDGNIAIQALDKLSGTDFSSTRVADKAANTGKLSGDDVFANMPLYSLLREEKKELKSGNPILDALLEDAIIVPDDYKENIREFIENYADDIAALNEAGTGYDVGNNPTSTFVAIGDKPVKDTTTTFDKYLMDLDDKALSQNNTNATVDAIMDRDTISAYKRGLLGMGTDGYEVYNKITTADIVVDPHMMDAAVNKSVGDILNDPKNVEIRDRFEKATFLLQSRRIAGVEYYQYLTLRLGIPVSDRARRALMQNFKIADVRQYGQGNTEDETWTNRGYVISRDDQIAIAKNRRVTGAVVRTICHTRLRPFLRSLATGTVMAGAGAGLGALLAWSLATPIGWAAIGGAIVGAATVGIAHIIRRIIKNRREKNKPEEDKWAPEIEGWERVEALIERLYATQNGFLKKDTAGDLSKEISISRGEVISSPKAEVTQPSIEDNKKSLAELIRQTSTDIGKVLREAFEFEDDDTFDISLFLDESYQAEFDDALLEACQELNSAENKTLCEDFLVEGLFSKVFGKKRIDGTAMPVEVKYIEKDKNKNAVIIPQSMAAQRFAYGSTEFERRDIKDRKYNQPLIMTVKFKERFSDGKFSDNELTAVIGILGKIIRVPSNEMAYILSENLKDNTIEGFLKDPTGKLNNMISDMIGQEKITREAKKLPQSAEIWKNLETVAALAAANKISGKKTNNIANAHIVFSQNEIDTVRNESGIDYLKDVKYGIKLMKRYSAFTLMVANDAGMRLFILDGKDSSSWDVVPYSAIAGKDGGDQLNAALTKLARLSE